MNSWAFLVVAIILEVCGTTCMKLAQGFTRPLPSALVFVFYGACFGFLTLALKRLDLSMAYAIWSGAGTALVALIGFGLFKEALTPLKITSLVLIVMGVAGLHINAQH